MLAKKVNGTLLHDFTPDAIVEAIEKAKKSKPPQIPSGADPLSKRMVEMAESI